MAVCFNPVKHSSISPLDSDHYFLFKSWLKINNFTYSDFNHSALCAITRTKLQKSVFIGCTYKDFVAFVLNRIIALGIKGEKNSIIFT